MEYTSFDQSYREVTSHLSSQRVSDVQGEIVSESCSCRDQTEDHNRQLKGDDPLTEKIREYGAKENISVIVASCLISPRKHL